MFWLHHWGNELLEKTEISAIYFLSQIQQFHVLSTLCPSLLCDRLFLLLMHLLFTECPLIKWTAFTTVCLYPRGCSRWLTRVWGLLRWLNNKEPTCQAGGLDSWAGEILWRRKWQPTPVLLLKIPWTEEPSGLQFMGLQRVRYDLVTKQQQQRKRLHIHNFLT